MSPSLLQWQAKLRSHNPQRLDSQTTEGKITASESIPDISASNVESVNGYPDKCVLVFQFLQMNFWMVLRE
jgi:hypothetical protein